MLALNWKFMFLVMLPLPLFLYFGCLVYAWFATSHVMSWSYDITALRTFDNRFNTQFKKTDWSFSPLGCFCAYLSLPVFCCLCISHLSSPFSYNSLSSTSLCRVAFLCLPIVSLWWYSSFSFTGGENCTRRTAGLFWQTAMSLLFSWVFWTQHHQSSAWLQLGLIGCISAEC